MIVVTVYYRKNDPSSDQVFADLEKLKVTVPHQLIAIDVGEDPGLDNAFSSSTPVVNVGPYQLRTPFTQKDLEVALRAANDRAEHLTRVGDVEYKTRLKRGHSLTKTDQFTYWLSRHFMAVFNLLVFIYVGLPFLAPVLMKVGATFPARVIYTVYSPLCHQLSFRSWFLFGEQPYYPLNQAHIAGVITYEEISNQTPVDYAEAKAFDGNKVVGYKVAICERDVAIYGSILAFGLIFSVVRKWVKKIPWYVWVGLGIIPIAIDGGSQLVGIFATYFPAGFPVRESTPFLRTLTGCLFGTFSAWYLYPVIDQSMQETKLWLTQKMMIVEELQSQAGKGP
jgi:uncharacterized membrane protein